jgi:hypothetical protein
MADYFTIINKAIANLPEQNSETRKAIYDRSRMALLKQLRGMTPALPEKDITRERLALEEAIRKIEFSLASQKPTPVLKPEPPLQTLEIQQPTPEPIEEPVTPPKYEHIVIEEAEPVKADAPNYEQTGKVKFDHPPEEHGVKKRNFSLMIGGGTAGLLLVALLYWAFSSPVETAATKHPDVVKLPSVPQTTLKPTEKKVEQRVAQDAPIVADKSPTKPPEQTNLPPRDSRVILIEEVAQGQQSINVEGVVKWRLGKAPDYAIIGEFSIPDRKMKASIVISQNKDKSLPASHLVDIEYEAGASVKVVQMPGFLMKAGEQTRGQPISAQAQRVTDNLYLIGLSAIEADITRNSELIKEWAYLDFLLEFDTRKRAVLTIEKGTTGMKVFQDAFAAWGQ